mgnify:FL=1
MNYWKKLTEKQKDEFIIENSKGCIENGETVFIELFVRVDNKVVGMDHNDYMEKQPFQSLQSILDNYEWDNEELKSQINETKDGVLKESLKWLLINNK